MWNVIKAQNYQIKRSNSTWYVILFGLAMYVLACFDMESLEFSEITGSAYFMQIRGMWPIVGVAMMLVLTCKVCGGDLTDKTLNYEILGGHSRRKIYFGRCIVAMLWSFGVGYLIVLIPVLFFTFIIGWGDYASWKAVLTCYGLAAFPFLRMLCGFVMLTFLVRNMYVAGILGWTFYSFSMIAMLILEAFDITATVHLGLSNLMKLLDFSNEKLEYIDGKDVMVGQSPLTASLTWQTVLVSLLLSALYLGIGYLYFKKSDQN